MRVHVALLLLLSLSAQSRVLAQDPCSGHGTQGVSGTCECSTPLPGADGSSGWVGEQCGQEVKRLPTDGSDTTVTVQPGTTLCWAATLDSPPTPLHYFAASVTLAPDSPGGVLLYALLAADPNAPPAGDGQPPALLYPRTAPGVGRWDYLASVVPAPGVPHEVLQLGGPEVAAVQARGVYLCAVPAPPRDNPPTAPPAAATFTLRAAGHSCPLTLHDNGFISICSSTPEDVRYSSPVCPAGVCECTGPWQRPDAPVDPGLGFETCAARVDLMGEPPAAAPTDPLSVSVTGHPGLVWRFWNFTVAPGLQQVAVHVTATAPTTSHVSVYLRPLQPPGRLPEEHAARTEWSDFSGDLSASMEVAVSPGVWYVGVWVFGDAPLDYTLAVRRSACPGAMSDCSGQGTCAADTGTCTCAPESGTAPDCTRGTRPLTLGSVVSVPATWFRVHELVLDDLGSVFSTPTVELQLTASFNTPAPLPAWVTSRPLVLASSAPPVQPPGAPHPEPGEVVVWAELKEPSKSYTLLLNANQVPQRKLWVYVFNPLSAPYQVGYSVSAETHASCLDDCSGHGTCGPDGRCTCQPGWLGASCSVDASSLSNATATCVPGSRLPVRREEQHATCWTPCDPDTGEHDASHCADFTCDPTNAEGVPQRRAGGKEECVSDLCGPSGANITVTDPSGSFVCARACVCPEDGSLCALDPGCVPGTMRCLDGLVLRAAPDGTPQCVPPPGSGTCEEGSLRLALAMDGGSGYGVCVCKPSAVAAAFPSGGTPASLSTRLLPSAAAPEHREVFRAGVGTGRGVGGDGWSCDWTEPAPADVSGAGGSMPPGLGVVACAAGYQIAGAVEGGLVLTDGRKLTSGGHCVKVQPTRKGVSGGMVFFWCLFSVALSATLVVGGRRALEWYEARRWEVGGDGDGFDDHRSGWTGYVRLGLDTLLNNRRGDGGGAGHW